MEQQFKIIRNENHYATWFSLMGNFDETAARALVEAMREEAAAERIVVRTGCISGVMNGIAEFHSKALSEVERFHSRVIFSGEHAWDIAPRGAIVY